MTALTPDGLARIEELTEKATPGPWEFFTVHNEIVSLETGTGTASVIDAYGEHTPGWLQIEDADMRFIEASRTAVPALVAGVRTLQARITELEAVIAEAPHGQKCDRWHAIPCDCWKSRYQVGADHE